MDYFWDTVETIPEGMGFSLFGTAHLIWLGILAAAAVINCVWYCRMDGKGRERWRRTVAAIVVVNEILKDLVLILGGNFMAKYLPLHLCGINIILVAIHAWRPAKLLGNFLYLTCIPGAMAAMLFCNWTVLPMANLMCLHSFTVHILLILYPLVLTAAGDIRPQVREFPRCLLLLFAMAVPIYFVNMAVDTNFMFLMYPETGNPLSWFEEHWGNHLLGYPILLAVVLGVMAIPARLLERRIY